MRLFRRREPLHERLRADGDLTPEEAAFTGRVEALVQLIDLLDGFTSTLLPFLKGRSVEKVYEIVRFASRLRGGAPPASPSGDAP